MSASSEAISRQLASLRSNTNRRSVIESLQNSLENTRYATAEITRQANQLESQYDFQQQLARSQLRVYEAQQKEQIKFQREQAERAAQQQERNNQIAAEAERVRQAAVQKVTGGDTERAQLLASEGVLDGLVQQQLQADNQLMRSRPGYRDDKTFELTPMAQASELAEQSLTADLNSRLANAGVDPAAYQQQVASARRGLEGSGFFGNTVPSIGAAAIRGVGGLAGGATSLVGQAIGSDTVEELGADLARDVSSRLADPLDVSTPEERAASRQMGQRVEDFSAEPGVANAFRLAGNVIADTVTNPAAIGNLVEQSVGAGIGGAGLGALARGGVRLATRNAPTRVPLARAADVNPLGTAAIAVGQGSSFADNVQDLNVDPGIAAAGGAATIGLGAAGGAIARGLGLQTVDAALTRPLAGAGLSRTGQTIGQSARQAPSNLARGATGETIQEGFEGFGEGATGELARGGSIDQALVAGAGGAAAGAGAGAVLGGGLGAARSVSPLASAEQRDAARTKRLQQRAAQAIAEWNRENGVVPDAEVRIPLTSDQNDAVLQQLSPSSREEFLRNFVNSPQETRREMLNQFGEALSISDTEQFQRALDSSANAEQFFAGVPTDSEGTADPADLIDIFSNQIGVQFELDAEGRVSTPQLDAAREATFDQAQADNAAFDASQTAAAEQAAQERVLTQQTEQANVELAEQAQRNSDLAAAPTQDIAERAVLSRVLNQDNTPTPEQSQEVNEVLQAPLRQRGGALDEARLDRLATSPLRQTADRAGVDRVLRQDNSATVEQAQEVNGVLQAPQRAFEPPPAPAADDPQFVAAAQTPQTGFVTPELQRILYAATPPDTQSVQDNVPDVDALIDAAPNSAAIRRALGNVRTVMRTTTGIEDFDRTDLQAQDTFFGDMDAESAADLRFEVGRLFAELDQAGIRDLFFEAEADVIAERGTDTGKKPEPGSEPQGTLDLDEPATVPVAVSAPTEPAPQVQAWEQQNPESSADRADSRSVELATMAEGDFDFLFALAQDSIAAGKIDEGAVSSGAAMTVADAGQRLQVADYLTDIGLEPGNAATGVSADPRRSYFLRGPDGRAVPPVDDLQTGRPAPQDAFDPETGEVLADDVSAADIDAQTARLEGYDLLQQRANARGGPALSPPEVRAAIRETLQGGLRSVRVVDFAGAADPVVAPYRQQLQEQGLDDIDERTQGFVRVTDAGPVLYVNTANVRTANQARLFAAHEVLGHLGIRARYGPQLNSALSDVARSAGGVPGLQRLGESVGVSLRDQYPEVLRRARAGSIEARNILVEEIVAAGAEQSLQERTVPQIVRDAIADLGSRIKEWLTKLPGIGRIFDDFSDADLMRLVRESKSAARTVQGTGEIRQSRDRLQIFGAPGKARVLRPQLQELDSDGQPTGNTVDQSDPDETVDRTARGYVNRAKEASQDVYEAVMTDGKNIVDFSGKAPRIRAPSTGLSAEGDFTGSTAQPAGTRLKVSRMLDPFIKATANAAQAVRVAERGLRRAISNGTGLTYRNLRSQARSYLDEEIAKLDPSNSPDQDTRDQIARLQQLRDRLLPGTEGLMSFENDMATDMRMTNYAGMAGTVMGEQLDPLVHAVDDEIVALAQITKLSEKETKNNVESLLTLLSAQEENDAVYYVKTPLSDGAGEARQAIIDQLNGPSAVPDLALAAMGEIRDIVTNDKGAEVAARERLVASVSGLSNKQVEDGLAQLNYEGGQYDQLLEKVRDIHGYIGAQREAEGRINNPYRNWQAAYGFQYRIPNKFSTKELQTEGVDSSELSSLDATPIELDGNTLDNLKAYAARVTLNRHYNDVNRAVLINAMISKSSDPVSNQHRSATGDLYQGANIEVVDKHSNRYTELLVSSDANTFTYTDPESDTAVLVKFPNTANKKDRAISQIRGERFRFDAPLINRITSGMRYMNSLQGRMIMRYSGSSAVRSFFREIPTMAALVGSEFGPDRILPVLMNIWTSKGMAGGIFKYMRARLLEDSAAIERIVADDPRMAEFHEYVRLGGLVTQLQALRPEEYQQRFEAQNTNSNNVLTRGRGEIVNAVEGTMGALTDALDASIRFAAYQETLQQFGGNKERAAAYAKDLANFERRGTYGDVLGAWFLFFNPAASGTARIAESLLEGEHGATLAAYAAGAGFVMYHLLHAISDEDDESGENLLEREGPGRSVTDLRFHLSDETTLQLPIGFGAANATFSAGMQLAALLAGHQSMQEMSNHTLELAMGNFTPFQASRIPVINDKGEWQLTNKLLDTAAPQIARPFLQHAMNLNALGLQVYPEPFGNDAAGVNALSGAPRHIGTAAERLAVAMERLGGPDLNPGTIQHFTGAYFKAVAEVGEFVAEAINSAQGAPTNGRLVDQFPLAGGVFSRPGRSDGFYGKAARVQTMVNRWEDLERGNRQERVESEQAAAPWIAPQHEVIKQTRRELTEISKEFRDIIFNTSFGSQQRRQAINERNELRRELQRAALEQIEALESN